MKDVTNIWLHFHYVLDSWITCIHTCKKYLQHVEEVSENNNSKITHEGFDRYLITFLFYFR